MSASQTIPRESARTVPCLTRPNAIALLAALADQAMQAGDLRQAEDLVQAIFVIGDMVGGRPGSRGQRAMLFVN